MARPLLSHASPLLALTVALALAFVWPSAAAAQALPSANGDGFDSHLFRPALDARGLVSINGADVLPAGQVSLGLTIDYGRNLLRLPRVNGASRALIGDSFAGTLHFDYGIANRAIVGVSAPALLVHGDPQPGVTGWSPGPLDSQSIGFVALHGKLLLTKPSGPLGTAVAVQVGAPVSDAPRNGAADPGVWYWPSFILERRLGKEDQVRIAANVGYRGHAASTTALPLDGGTFRDGSRITYGAGASLRVLPALDLVAETYGTYLLGSSAASVRPSNEVLGGIKLFVDKTSYLVVGAGTRYTDGFEAADLRGVLGFVFEPIGADTDGDGVLDREDDCPTIAGVRSSEPGKNGCPKDSDDDGIPDTEDACPFVKGPRTNDPHTNGCPPIRDVPPPAEPPPDRDHDGVPDAVDACPDLPGARHPDPKRNGCPDVYVDPGGSIVVFDKILFETNSARILPESNPILDKVAAAFNGHPELLVVEVAGHADERGPEKLNVTLTQARVDSVMLALVARNVERGRLRARGYGFYCPVEEGHDEEAWSKNRRVEFLIVKSTIPSMQAPKFGCENATAHGIPPLPSP